MREDGLLGQELALLPSKPAVLSDCVRPRTASKETLLSLQSTRIPQVDISLTSLAHSALASSCSAAAPLSLVSYADPSWLSGR